jgi:hypothetical protein
MSHLAIITAISYYHLLLSSLTITSCYHSILPYLITSYYHLSLSSLTITLYYHLFLSPLLQPLTTTSIAGLVRNCSLADSSVDPNEFSDMQSLYSLLKREEESLAAATPAGGLQSEGESNGMELADEGKGSEGKPLQDQAPITVNKDDEDVELKPYKNDLTYMQDQIELSNRLSKIAGNNEKLEQLGNKLLVTSHFTSTVTSNCQIPSRSHFIFSSHLTSLFMHAPGEDDDDDDTDANAMYEYDRMGRPVGREKTQQKSENLIRKLRLKERIIRELPSSFTITIPYNHLLLLHLTTISYCHPVLKTCYITPCFHTSPNISQAARSPSGWL